MLLFIIIIKYNFHSFFIAAGVCHSKAPAVILSVALTFIVSQEKVLPNFGDNFVKFNQF